MGAADPEREVAVHAMMPPRQLVGELGLAGGERAGVGHLEHRRDAAQHRGAGAGLEIFLVGQAGIAKMHLAIDDARQDVEAGGVDHGGGARRRQGSDGADPTIEDPYITEADPVMIDERAALHEKIVGLRHVWAPSTVAPS